MGTRETHEGSQASSPSAHLQPLSRIASVSKRKRTFPAPYLASLQASSSSSSAAPAFAFLNRSDISEHHKKLTASVMQALPAGCRDHLKNFSVIYKDAKYRGLGGKTTIILDGSVKDTEFVALLIHECGHVISGNMLGAPSAGESSFRDGKDVFYRDGAAVSFFSVSWENERTLKKGTKDADFVSGYASSDIFEDFAETFAAYVLQRPYLRKRAETNESIARKLAWMEANLPLSETAVGNAGYAGSKDLPWDVTKLPYASLLDVR